MTNDELIVKSSIQLFIADKEYPKPQGFGSGCILIYEGQKYLISVSHVTDHGLTTFLETNQPPIDNTTPLKPVGGLIYYNLLNLKSNITAFELEKELENGGQRLDITFAKVEEPLDLLQPELNIDNLKITAGKKVFIDATRIVKPNKNERYGFYGKVRPEYIGYYLKTTPTLKNNLTYTSTVGNFHIFVSDKIILDKEDYEGCSGAPILDNQGNLVALACKIRVNSKLIYGFSIQECVKLLKITIDTKQI